MLQLSSQVKFFWLQSSDIPIPTYTKFHIINMPTSFSNSSLKSLKYRIFQDIHPKIQY
uniref:Uncharacterized protein n=1 Tax=Octopus bimaculoides TaxID=37653 RepID=A0A0L8FPE5_OCTBM